MKRKLELIFTSVFYHGVYIMYISNGINNLGSQSFHSAFFTTSFNIIKLMLLCHHFLSMNSTYFVNFITIIAL